MGILVFFPLVCKVVHLVSNVPTILHCALLLAFRNSVLTCGWKVEIAVLQICVK